MSGIFISIHERRSPKPISAASAANSGRARASRPLSRLSGARATGCEMSRRWVEIFRTTSARLAMLYAGLFAISVGVLFDLIYWAATDVLSDRINQDFGIRRQEVVAQAGT